MVRTWHFKQQGPGTVPCLGNKDGASHVAVAKNKKGGKLVHFVRVYSFPPVGTLVI